MKKLLTMSAFLLMGIIILAQDAPTGVIIEVRELAPFNQLRVSRGINVTLIEGEKPQAEIHIENTTPEDVIIVQSNKVLTIRMRARIYKDVAVNVYLTYQQINEISAGTGGSVFCEDVLEADELKLEAGADASIQLEVEVNKIVANASAARIELTGSADYIDVNVTTGGRFLGANLESREGNVRANTGANAQVWVTEKLEARAGSGARVEYTGDPSKIEVRTNLGGRVEEME